MRSEKWSMGPFLSISYGKITGSCFDIDSHQGKVPANFGIFVANNADAEILVFPRPEMGGVFTGASLGTGVNAPDRPIAAFHIMQKLRREQPIPHKFGTVIQPVLIFGMFWSTA